MTINKLNYTNDDGIFANIKNVVNNNADVIGASNIRLDEVESDLTSVQNDLTSKIEASDLQTALNAYVDYNSNMSFLPLRNTSILDLADTDKMPIGSIDGIIFGRGSVTGFGSVYRATNDAATTWELLTSALGGGTPNLIRKLGDGEVIIAENQNLWKSTGWATNPLTATWAAIKVSSANTGIQAFGVDVWNEHIILTGTLSRISILGLCTILETTA